MKKYILAAFTILIFAPANLPAQTNLVISNFVGTVDTSWTNQVIPKLNYNNGQIVQWLNDHNATNHAQDAAIYNLNVEVNSLTNNSGITNFVFTAVSTNYGSPPASIVTGVTNNIAYVLNIIPSGAPGSITTTNTIFNLSNAVVSSASYALLTTNFNFASSNYLGKFTNVAYVQAIGPEGGPGGAQPMTNATTSVSYSTTGTSGWTTNLPGLPNVLYVAVTCVATGSGNVHITGISNPMARGNTNDLTLQTTYVPTATDNRSPVPLGQLSTLLANTATFQATTTNYACFINGQRMIEANPPGWIFSTNASLVIDGTHTNLALSFSTVNLISGSSLIWSTNLLLFGGGFQTYTGPYTTSTGGGNTTWTIPMYALPQANGTNPGCAFFQVAAAGSGSMQSDYPLTVSGGTLIHSNTWNLVSITNGMVNGDILYNVSSNGQRLVDVQLSNNVVYLHPHW